MHTCNFDTQIYLPDITDSTLATANCIGFERPNVTENYYNLTA